MSGSLEQARAGYAWGKVGESPSKDYVNLAKGAPALIMQNGLMQTLAFLNSKGGEHQRLCWEVTGWLAKQMIVKGPGFDDAMSALHGSSSLEYARASDEALEVLRWIRQFAAARKR
jgi:CRISPR-associated protein Cmr5